MVPLIGIASGIGAGNKDCGEAAPFLHRRSDMLQGIKHQWIDLFFVEEAPDDPYERLSTLFQKVALQISKTFQEHRYLISIGGDHSCAIGTWSGVAEALRPSGDLGLLWIDAHMDSHTPETTPSGNIHGMPLAALMGYGDRRLTEILSEQPKLLPQNIALVGIRSFESDEAALLERLGARIYFMDEIAQRGLSAVMQEAVEIVSKNTAGYGVSFDLDSLDPCHAPAVGTPVPHGLDPEELLASFSSLYEKAPLAFELVEYNPSLDPDLSSAKLLIRFLERAAQFSPVLDPRC